MLQKKKGLMHYMPRIARQNLTSNFVHLIVQGINQEFIFSDDNYKSIYKQIIKNNLPNYNVNLLAYCIMGNHSHFLFYSENSQELTKLMHSSNTIYAMNYNKSNNRKGYVFRDRFFSQAILNYNHLFNCLVYIHKNPINAKLSTNFKDYNFSSYNEFINKKDLITLDSIKLLFNSTENYIEQFHYLHKNIDNFDTIADVNDSIFSPKQIIENFEAMHNKNIEEIKVKPELFGLLLLELRKDCEMSLRQMAVFFGINKNKLNSYIHLIIDRY